MPDVILWQVKILNIVALNTLKSVRIIFKFITFMCICFLPKKAFYFILCLSAIVLTKPQRWCGKLDSLCGFHSGAFHAVPEETVCLKKTRTEWMLLMKITFHATVKAYFLDPVVSLSGELSQGVLDLMVCL